ncbi:MAG: replication-associated recombination protein A, partial [Candidatus Omnitrophica bacterium]|nr:replication-associated recombination protein A [Candidatus Omnitrophota bacterium]
ASEDVGNADPLALVLAHAAMQISECIGLPEAQIPLAQAAIYIASAPKSNASYMAIKQAGTAVEEERTQAVPVHLKNTVYKGAPGYSAAHNNDGYKYPHDYEGNHVKQEYMEQARSFYLPTQNGYEAKIKARLERARQISAHQKEYLSREET